MWMRVAAGNGLGGGDSVYRGSSPDTGVFVSHWKLASAGWDRFPLGQTPPLKPFYPLRQNPIRSWPLTPPASVVGVSAELDAHEGGALEPFPHPDPNTLTAGELWAYREALEAAAASLLGHMLFEFSRIDVNLGLCLVWVDNGANLEGLTPKVAELSFHDKLGELAKQVRLKLPAGSKRRAAYDRWIERSHTARAERNRLVHGRWGIEAHRSKVVNVVGLPTGRGQQEIEYSIDELAAVNEELRSIELELRRLRTHWPL